MEALQTTTAVVRDHECLNVVVVAAGACLTVALIAHRAAPILALSALLTFFFINSAYFYLRSVHSTELRRRIVNAITAASSFSTPMIVLVAIAVMR